MVVSIPDKEERVFEGIQKYLLENEKFSVMNPTQNLLLKFPGLKIDLETREIWKNTKKIVLTDLEFRLLLFLAKSPGRVFSYQQIMELKICPASGKDFHFNLCYPVIGICFCGIHLPDSCRSDWLYKKHDGSLQE